MQEVTMDTFEELEIKIDELYSIVEAKREQKTSIILHDPIFRGQHNVDWKLETTLERIYQTPISIEEYHHIIKKSKVHIENCLNEKFDLPNFESAGDNFPIIPQGISFMSFLRHHKFPTPLLDWTKSLYIAAFFAFNNSSIDKNIAIFTYIDSLEYGKYNWEDESSIFTTGHDIPTHKRHFLQQSQYTICTKKTDEFFYWNHEDVFKRNDPGQDIIYKFILPGSIKQSVLSKLDKMNINAYSLYDDTESLFNTIAKRNFPNKYF